MALKKQSYHRISVVDLSPHFHGFSHSDNKVEKVYHWLKNWIVLSLECGKIQPYDLLPSKDDLAYYIGVSQGTIQAVYRLLEDNNIVESKQRIGTYIKSSQKERGINKLTSKREQSVEIIKRYIVENKYQVGEKFISIRKLSKIIGVSNSTLRFAIVNLVELGILKKKDNNFIILKNDFNIKDINKKTLVDKLTDKLREYIKDEFNPGLKLPSNIELSKKFKVSEKTVHDAIRRLNKEGLLYIRRGQYGTIIANLSEDKNDRLYFYEKIERKLKQYIIDNCQSGDKIPTVRELSSYYHTSEKTIKKALNNLAEEGYVTFARGRNGGTYVLDIPQLNEDVYQWLAISSDYVVN